MQNNSQILVLITPLEIKDDLVDVLMNLDLISGFSLALIDGYSQEHSHYNINEQVEGHRKFYRFEILHSQKDEDNILNSLRAAGSNQHVRYWVLPVKSNGKL